VSDRQRVQLDEVEFERLGRLRGEMLEAENDGLRARVRALEAELAGLEAARHYAVRQAAYHAELGRLGKEHAFDIAAAWVADPETHSLVAAAGAGGAKS
jgi:hypothetical protein